MTSLSDKRNTNYREMAGVDKYAFYWEISLKESIKKLIDFCNKKALKQEIKSKIDQKSSHAKAIYKSSGGVNLKDLADFDFIITDNNIINIDKNIKISILSDWTKELDASYALLIDDVTIQNISAVEIKENEPKYILASFNKDRMNNFYKLYEYLVKKKINIPIFALFSYDNLNDIKIEAAAE